ncbi:MAG: hypothetical protein QW179_01245 [Candidatus Hadarchaeales archaeon]
MGVAEPEVAKILIDVLERIGDEVDGAVETLEILADEETLKAIEEGLNDIRAGNLLSFEEFLKKHGYR